MSFVVLSFRYDITGPARAGCFEMCAFQLPERPPDRTGTYVAGLVVNTTDGTSSLLHRCMNGWCNIIANIAPSDTELLNYVLWDTA